MLSNYIFGSAAILLVYDITDLQVRGSKEGAMQDLESAQID